MALDRLARLCQRRHVPADAERYSRARGTVREAIEAHGFNERLGSYVSVFDGDDVDASPLLLSLVGYAHSRSARTRGTLTRVRERLGVNGLLYRYLDEDDGVGGTESAFGICNSWNVEARAWQGDVADATDEFEHLLSLRNDVGLFAEEIDVRSEAAVGKFLQAFTHVA